MLLAKLYRVKLTEPSLGTYFIQPLRAVFLAPGQAGGILGRRALACRGLAGIPCEGEGRRPRDSLHQPDREIRSDQITGRTWGEKGKTPVARRSGNPFSVKAMSAISTKGRMHFMVLTESFTAEVMCHFLNRLAGAYSASQF
ncbi:transposase [Streptomyces albidoflavus]